MERHSEHTANVAVDVYRSLIFVVGIFSVFGGGALSCKMLFSASSLIKIHEPARRRICYVLVNACLFGVGLVLISFWSMPSGTFNMRVIPSLQEINAMFIITSAGESCDGATLPDPSVARHPTYPISNNVEEEKFTIIINTFHRTALLLQSLRHYSTMQRVEKIVVYWSNVGEEPPDLNAAVQSRVPIVVKIMEKTNLSLRFSPSDAISTQGVFNVDDDLIINEEDVNHAFYVWRYHPHGLVGFTPRTHEKSSRGNFKYYRLPLFVGNYSIILTNAAFMHRHYLSLFAKELPQQMKDYIDKWTNCEDIAMNYVVSRHCKCAGVFYVKPKHPISDGGGTVGLSRRGQHAAIRDSCVGLLSKLYPDVSLKWVRCRY